MRELLLAATCCVLAAADDHTEIRLLAGGYPGFQEVTYYTDGVETYRLDDHRGVSIQVEAVRRYESGGPFHPWLLGGGAVRFSDAADSGGADHTVVSGSWMLGAGVGARLGRHVLLEAGLVGSAGEAGVGDERLDAVSIQDTTWYLSGEARVGIWMEFDRAMFGVVGGSAVHRAWADFREREDSDHPLEMSTAYDGDGPFILIGIGLRLD